MTAFRYVRDLALASLIIGASACSMIRSEGLADDTGQLHCRVFEDELYGIEGTLERLVDYFKAASAGSEVGRRLLLLLGPPSGGKSSLVILLKRGLEEYSHTEAGALYAVQGCPVHESPLHLVPHTMKLDSKMKKARHCTRVIG